MKSKSSHKLFKATLATTVAAGAFVVAVPLATNAAVSFTDVKPGVHYYEPVLELATRDVVKGYDDGTYRPNQSVTRAQSAKILAHVLDLDTQNVKDPGFADVKKGTPYYGPIAALAQAGYIKGYEEKGVKTFKPNNNLTRSQMAKILTLGFGLKEEELVANRFADVNPSDAYAGYVAALLNKEITTGTTNTTFEPNGLVTRGQMSTFVVRTEMALNKTKPETPEVPEDKPVIPNVPGDKPETPEVPDQPTNPTPPVEQTGDQLLHVSIVDMLAKGSASTDAIGITLSGNTFKVNIKKPTSTINDFSVAAKPIYDAFKVNTKIDTVKISVIFDGQTITLTENNVDHSQDFETILNKALSKLGMSGDTTIGILRDKTIKVNVIGSIDSKRFNSTYDFKF
ncbi:S-layer homology domain-containing protein [Sporosarcina sp. P26b]|uniref:S-layer homology domain-containing protein n=1 Tax=Sporosarcina sp. P26b TaxID=2048253 RepID=UPI0013041575|nr:S-layer homology domain-containing protein [Sporosarcina sp. P26b]